MVAISELERINRSTDDDLQLSAFVAELDGIDPPDAAPEHGHCRCCGLEGAGYDVSDVFSNAFTDSDENKSLSGPVCYRCEYLASNKDYRRYHWIATEDGIEITKERPELLNTLLDPPEGRWMMQVTDGFLRTMNGWLSAQPLNVSRDTYRVLDDTDIVHIDRRELAEMVGFARRLRARDDEPAKRVLTEGATPADYDRYDLTRADNEIIKQYRGRADWNLAVRLIQ